MKKDLTCPKCDAIFDFKNFIVFDDTQMVMLGIVYQVKCLNCGTVFITDKRETIRQTPKQAEDLLKKAITKLKQKEK